MTSETALATTAPVGAALAEQVAIKGDLSKLTEAERMAYYSATCASLGLNPLTRPFDYLTLNGKLILYANRSCADQLRTIRGITITNLDPRQVGDLLVCVATGRDRNGREDSSTGAVNVKGLTGEALANAMMKAETKAKRRLTLSLAGLGWTDESEVDTIPGAARTDVDADGVVHTPTLAERVAARAAEIQKVPDVIEGEATEFTPAEVEQIAEAMDAVPTMSRDEFNRRRKAAGTRIDREHAAKALGISTVDFDPDTLTPAQWYQLAVVLGLA